MRGAHRASQGGTPVPELLAQLQAERGAQLPSVGLLLPGTISDRLRAMDPAAGVEVSPERGTEKHPGVPPAAYTGVRLSGRTRDPWKDDHAES
jgi:hypothetical protein